MESYEYCQITVHHDVNSDEPVVRSFQGNESLTESLQKSKSQSYLEDCNFLGKLGWDLVQVFVAKKTVGSKSYEKINFLFKKSNISP